MQKLKTRITEFEERTKTWPDTRQNDRQDHMEEIRLVRQTPKMQCPAKHPSWGHLATEQIRVVVSVPSVPLSPYFHKYSYIDCFDWYMDTLVKRVTKGTRGRFRDALTIHPRTKGNI
jgi:hypothetical protein